MTGILKQALTSDLVTVIEACKKSTEFYLLHPFPGEYLQVEWLPLGH